MLAWWRPGLPKILLNSNMVSNITAEISQLSLPFWMNCSLMAGKMWQHEKWNVLLLKQFRSNKDKRTKVWFPLPCSVSLSGAAVRSDESLTGSFGETLKLDTPDTQLIGEYEIIWSHVQGGTTTVLIDYDAGEWRKNATDKHQLDEKTGSLIIRSLTANDSGRYQRQFINGSELIVKTQKFIVTVVGQ